ALYTGRNTGDGSDGKGSMPFQIRHPGHSRARHSYKIPRGSPDTTSRKTRRERKKSNLSISSWIRQSVHHLQKYIGWWTALGLDPRANVHELISKNRPKLTGPEIVVLKKQLGMLLPEGVKCSSAVRSKRHFPIRK